jgi:hypothetical protein
MDRPYPTSLTFTPTPLEVAKSSIITPIIFSVFVTTNIALLHQQLMVIARSGIPPENWSIGLQVMLKNIAGVCLVEKLRAIQLCKSDFNCYNQFVFRKEAMNTLNSINYMPEELFSQKGSTGKDAKFNKTLVADLSRQAC